MPSIAHEQNQVVCDGCRGDRDIRETRMPANGNRMVRQTTSNSTRPGIDRQDAAAPVVDQGVQPLGKRGGALASTGAPQLADALFNL